MFGIKKSKQNRESSFNKADDLLAESEEAEFNASVLRAKTRLADAQERADQSLQDKPKAARLIGILDEEDIVWNDQQDVFRPTSASSAQVQALLGVEYRVSNPPFSIYARQDVLHQIEKHLKSDMKIELGGLLAGRVFHDSADDSYSAVIEAAFPALDGLGTPTHFEYTSAAWEAITPLLKEMNSDWTVIGSYHSHPGLGVFLSKTDLDTQAEIFYHDWQIALVIDPVSGKIGYFTGPHGKPCKDWRLIDG